MNHKIYIAECTCGAWDVSKEKAFKVHERSNKSIRANCRVSIREITVPKEKKHDRSYMAAVRR